MPDPLAPQSSEEAKDERALGHTIILILKNPKAIIAFLLTIIAGLSTAGIVNIRKPQAVHADVIEKLEALSDGMKKMTADVVEIKVIQYAILQTSPIDQRRRAQELINIQMQAIKMSKN